MDRALLKANNEKIVTAEYYYKNIYRQGLTKDTICPYCRIPVHFVGPSSNGRGPHFRRSRHKVHKKACPYRDEKTIKLPGPHNARKIVVGKINRKSIPKEVKIKIPGFSLSSGFDLEKYLSPTPQVKKEKRDPQRVFQGPEKERTTHTVYSLRALAELFVTDRSVRVANDGRLEDLILPLNRARIGRIGFYYLELFSISQIVVKENFIFVNSTDIQEPSLLFKEKALEDFKKSLLTLTESWKKLEKAYIFVVAEPMPSLKLKRNKLILEIKHPKSYYLLMVFQ